MNSLKIILFILTSSLIISSEDLYDMDLEDLLNIEVYTASKSVKNEFESPGIVQVISSEEIELLGGQNLFEILNRATNIVASKTLGPDRISIRGDDPTSAHSHVLFLINGRPFYNFGGNYVNYNLYYAFPLKSVEKIEILRGPGSVLYGTNAVNGVINIITKDAQESKIELDFSIGDFQTRMGNISFGYGDDNFKSFNNIHMQDGLGGNYKSWNNGNEDVDFNLRNNNYVFSFFSKNSFDKFSFDVYYGHSEQYTHSILSIVDNQIINVLSPPDSISDQILYQSSAMNANFGYKESFSKYFNVKADISYNRENFIWLEDDFRNGKTPVITTNGEEYFAETKFDGFITKVGKADLNYLGGYLFNKSIGNASAANPVPFNRNIHSGYNEINYGLKSENLHLDLRAGSHYYKVDKIDGKLLPRLSLLFAYDKFGIKTLYSGAFRAPTPPEQTFDNFNLDGGNPNLVPELSNNFDFQMFFNSEDLTAAIIL